MLGAVVLAVAEDSALADALLGGAALDDACALDA
jgi:hypothetical protein